MKRYLMVCYGNICRSPLGQGILAQKLNENNILAEVDSAGTAGHAEGKSPDRRSCQVALQHGIDISHQRARQFVLSDFNRFDHIFTMDKSNYNNILRLTSSDKYAKKVSLILNQSIQGSNQEVPDPYYGGMDGFETVFKLIDEACENFVKKLL